MHGWERWGSLLARAAMAALLGVCVLACENSAEKRAREILERHKAEFRKCHEEKEELLALATQDPPQDIAELKRHTERLRRQQNSFQNNNCIGAFHKRVDSERAAANVDPAVFNTVLHRTVEEWEREWSSAER